MSKTCCICKNTIKNEGFMTTLTDEIFADAKCFMSLLPIPSDELGLTTDERQSKRKNEVDKLVQRLVNEYKEHKIKATEINLTFNYRITESEVAFNGRPYTKSEFIELLKEIDLLTRSESTALREHMHGAEFILILEDGQVLIPAEIRCVAHFIKLGLMEKAEYTLTVFNKHFGYFLVGDYVVIIDDEKTRHGIFSIKDLVLAGMPVSDTKIPIAPEGTLSLSNNEYPLLSGSHIGMGFTKKDYKIFLEILKTM